MPVLEDEPGDPEGPCDGQPGQDHAGRRDERGAERDQQEQEAHRHQHAEDERRVAGQGLLQIVVLCRRAPDQAPGRQGTLDRVNDGASGRGGRTGGRDHLVEGPASGSRPWDGGRHPLGMGQGGQGGRLVRSGDHDLQRARRARPKRPGDLVIADSGVGRGRDDGDGRHGGSQPDHRGGGQAEDAQRGETGGKWMAPQGAPPGMEALLQLVAVRILVAVMIGAPFPTGALDAARVDAGTEAAEDGGQQGQGGCEHGHDGEHDADCHGAKRRARDEQDGGERGENSQSGEGDSLAGSGHRLGDRVHRHRPGTGIGAPPVQRGAEPDHDEQCVVDPQGEGEPGPSGEARQHCAAVGRPRRVGRS